jgi:hypothetical protein
MQSTLSGRVPEYIGADLTDRYSTQCRDIDVCGLTPEGERCLSATFWHWQWDPAPQPLEVAGIVSELRGARVAMLDGPQALASEGIGLRVCERRSACVGKTPDKRPATSKPFGGFICSSLDLFTALVREGVAISPPRYVGGGSEVYPGHIWTILSGRRPLPQKSTQAGRLVRKQILAALGVCGLPSLPTHDENDACVAALVAAAADGQVSGVSVVPIGEPLSVDPAGRLREGLMIVPQVTAEASERIAGVLREFPVFEPPPSRATKTVPATLEDPAALLQYFVGKALDGDPQVCSYGWAYRKLFHASYKRYSQAFTQKVVDVAKRTRAVDLPGLGPVRLDSFVVSKSDRRPSDGYWPAAHHTREEWERSLGCATILD